MTDPEVTAARRGPGTPARVAAALAWFAGVGFGLPGLYAIWYFARHDQVWMFLGNPTYGPEPSEDGVFPASLTLIVLFLLVCVAEVLVGWMLWHGRPKAAVVSLVLLPIEFVFWIGFVLPAGPLLGLARTALVLRVEFAPLRLRRR
jgi:hypothetical protein